MSLLEALKQKQVEAGLSDVGFARSLGVSRSLWYFTRRGEMGIGEKVLHGTLWAYPDLNREVLQWLRVKAGEVAQ